MLATNTQRKIIRTPQKIYLNLDSYKPRNKPSVLCSLPVNQTIEYLQHIELIRIFESGRINYDD